MIATSTKLVGLLGNPISHSFSPIMQNSIFSAKGLDYYYLPIECELDDLGDIVRGIRRMNFCGFNITKPFKVEIIKHIDELDSLAALIGSVNTVKKVESRLIGYNTDGTGFIESLKVELGFRADDNHFLILGAGGSARAIAVSLACAGAKQILVTDILPEMSRNLTECINNSIRTCAVDVENNPDSIRLAINESSCLINASGVGMHPQTHLSPVKKQWLRRDLTVCDLTYNPPRTQLLIDAQSIGCQILNGLGMLVHQGAKAFEIWTGQPSPALEMMEICKELIRTTH
jgi:shikimate dehydrogenase